MPEHGVIDIWPDKGTIACRCGALGSIGHLDHFRIHGCEPTVADLETLWKRSISWRERVSPEPAD